MGRESWGNRFGFIMATAGFSIGLGNIWRFPYVVGTNGGGAFVLVYLAIIVLICIPLFTMEVGLGRRTQLNPIEGMRSITKKGSGWVSFGWIGVIVAFLILTYYIQIMGWVLIYFVKMINGSLKGLTTEEYASTFDGITANTLLIAGAALACSVLIALISIKGLEKGIERASKILMPALFIMMIILAIRSLTLPGSMEGLKWYLNFDLSAITGGVVLTALGQSFFSIGIAAGGAFIYGSYLKRNSNIPGDATIIIGLDTLAALLIGLVIFPAIFSMGLDVDEGSSLLFVTMSNLFAHIPLGGFFGGMFFLLIFFAAITSALGYLEPIVMTCTELFKMSRVKAVIISLTVIFIVGFPNILGYGIWSNVIIGGMNLFDFTDYLSGNIMMPLGALVLSFYTVFSWTFKKYRQEVNMGAKGMKVFNWWRPLITALLPIALVIIFLSGLM